MMKPAKDKTDAELKADAEFHWPTSESMRKQLYEKSKYLYQNKMHILQTGKFTKGKA